MRYGEYKRRAKGTGTMSDPLAGLAKSERSYGIGNTCVSVEQVSKQNACLHRTIHSRPAARSSARTLPRRHGSRSPCHNGRTVRGTRWS